MAELWWNGLGALLCWCRWIRLRFHPFLIRIVFRSIYSKCAKCRINHWVLNLVLIDRILLIIMKIYPEQEALLRNWVIQDFELLLNLLMAQIMDLGRINLLQLPPLNTYVDSVWWGRLFSINIALNTLVLQSQHSLVSRSGFHGRSIMRHIVFIFHIMVKGAILFEFRILLVIARDEQILFLRNIIRLIHQVLLLFLKISKVIAWIIPLRSYI